MGWDYIGERENLFLELDSFEHEKGKVKEDV